MYFITPLLKKCSKALKMTQSLRQKLGNNIKNNLRISVSENVVKMFVNSSSETKNKKQVLSNFVKSSPLDDKITIRIS